MFLQNQLTTEIQQAFSKLFSADVSGIKLEQTRPGFEGDYTFVVFPFLQQSKKSLEQTAELLGKHLTDNSKLISRFNVVKGFLNLVIAEGFWIDFVRKNAFLQTFGTYPPETTDSTMVEYSSPNTNKPLHLGHVRNNLLGWSIAEILKANGKRVVKVNLVNDRGIHICKSMVAWLRYGNGETPAGTGMKGDKFVGKYYVEFDLACKKEINELVAGGMAENEAEKNAPLLQAAQEMLRQWEAGNEEVLRVWNLMNGWVYEGFAESYRRLGVDFDAYYYESKTYLLGKEYVQEGLAKKVFYQKDDGSVWIDLKADGLDEKIVQRSDGTSVYITQDIGTAEMKYNDFGCDTSIYVVANEQDYHFKVLKLILQKLGKPYADGIFHFNYGMVDLPTGKMKSREGTVVDADDLMDELIAEAKAKTAELGKTDGMEQAELQNLYTTLGMGALKYYILKVDPQKRMLFNPAESIDLHGNTGPFIQYTYARIRSVMRAAGFDESKTTSLPHQLHPAEKEVALHLHSYPMVVAEAGRQHSPALVAAWAYEMAKHFNRLYHDLPLLKEPDPTARHFRLMLSQFTANTLQKALHLLGIGVVERM